MRVKYPMTIFAPGTWIGLKCPASNTVLRNEKRFCNGNPGQPFRSHSRQIVGGIRCLLQVRTVC